MNDNFIIILWISLIASLYWQEMCMSLTLSTFHTQTPGQWKNCIEFEQRCINRSLTTFQNVSVKTMEEKESKQERQRDRGGRSYTEWKLNEPKIKVSINFWFYLFMRDTFFSINFQFVLKCFHIAIEIGLTRPMVSQVWQLLEKGFKLCSHFKCLHTISNSNECSSCQLVL